MTEKLSVYKCDHCGLVVEVLHQAGGAPVCCGVPMVEQVVKAVESEGKEKHVPVCEKLEQGCVVKVGSVPHPMQEDHYIEWISIQTKKGEYKKFLAAGDAPELECGCDCEPVAIRAYCNKHGLWQS